MAVTIDEIEAKVPILPRDARSLYQAPPISRVDMEALWFRLENYVRFRWSPRSVNWVVEGSGPWSPPLKPCVFTSVERWDGDLFETIEPRPNWDGGFVFESDGPFRITATVGEETDLPFDVREAFKRMVDYTALDYTDARRNDPSEVYRYHGGAHSQTETVGSFSHRIDRDPKWLARIMTYSGAADLLRPYRRIK